ncbi:MAG: winged helix-turn-helix domain-containing protein [Candidatus Heimdallarchaeaceae archaeon]
MTAKKRNDKQHMLWKALSNPIRRELISFIGEKSGIDGSVSFTQIQHKFEMKVGTLYHHLDSLGDLITQDEKKRYLLTIKGKQAYNLIEDELDSVAKDISSYGSFIFLHKFFLRSFFDFIRKDSLRFFGVSLFVFSGLIVATYFISYSPIFLFPSYITPQYLAPVIFVFSTLIIYLLAEILSLVLFRKKHNKLALFQAIVFAQVPLILFCIFEYFVTDFTYPASPLDLDLWLFLLFVLIQVLFLGILIESLIVIKELRMEKAGLIALLVVYTLSVFSFLVLKGLVVLI